MNVSDENSVDATRSNSGGRVPFWKVYATRTRIDARMPSTQKSQQMTLTTISICPPLTGPTGRILAGGSIPPHAFGG